MRVVAGQAQPFRPEFEDTPRIRTPGPSVIMGIPRTVPCTSMASEPACTASTSSAAVDTICPSLISSPLDHVRNQPMFGSGRQPHQSSAVAQDRHRPTRTTLIGLHRLQVQGEQGRQASGAGRALARLPPLNGLLADARLGTAGPQAPTVAGALIVAHRRSLVQDQLTPTLPTGTTTGVVQAVPVLSGLHHPYLLTAPPVIARKQILVCVVSRIEAVAGTLIGFPHTTGAKMAAGREPCERSGARE